MTQRIPFDQRFWSKVDKTGECWLWTGSRDPRGYGQMSATGPRGTPPLKAHRISWVLAFGPIPDDLWVLHHCDNPPCVRPEHLFLGDHAANMADMTAKRRNGNANAKITRAQAEEVRQRRASGEPVDALAIDYGLSVSSIYQILGRQRWR